MVADLAVESFVAVTAALSGLTALEAVFVVMEVVVAALGLTISYIAYRGYRRHRSRPMAFVAVGFVLLVGVPELLAIGLLAGLIENPLQALFNRVSTLVGLASILYGLWVDPGD